MVVLDHQFYGLIVQIVIHQVNPVHKTPFERMDPLLAVKAKSEIAESAFSQVLVTLDVSYLVASW